MGSMPERETADDHELVERSKTGDRSAFEALVRKYQDRTYSVAYQILRHHDDALDVVQEAFARAYLSIGRFRGRAGFYTWLYRIVVNLAIDATRAGARRNPARPADPRGEVVRDEFGPDPWTALEAKELGERIAKAVALLSVKQRTVLTLRELDGLSYRDIAHIMNCPVGVVRSRLHAARRTLQRMLGYEEEAP
jgi:RNA polymerase sigma-70 factor (ECF subfamily)